MNKYEETIENHYLVNRSDCMFYLKRDDGRMMSTLLVFTPENIIITGDYCPDHPGVISAFGYGLKWFIGDLSEDYLAEKFLKKKWCADNARWWVEEEIRYQVEEEGEDIQAPSTVRLETLLELKEQNYYDNEFEFFSIWKDYAQDCDDHPGYTYLKHEVEMLASIQKKFAQLYKESTK